MNESPDLVVIGLDPAGYDLALGAALLGARVVLATNGETSARFALRDGEALHRMVMWAIKSGEAAFSRVACSQQLARVLREMDMARSPERLRAAGVRVLDGSAAFISPRAIRVGPEELTARRFVIATGRGAPGSGVLAEWDDPGAIPRQISIEGGDGTAIALATLCRRMGIAASLYSGGGFLPDEEPEAAERIAIALRQAGIAIHESAAVGETIRASDPHPALAGLALDIGEVESKGGALVCDGGLRTSNSRVFAIGAVVAAPGRVSAGPSQIGPLLARMLLRKSCDFRGLPDIRLVQASPGFAATGMSERVARNSGQFVRILRSPIADAQGRQPGLLKAIIGRKGRILGVTIVADHAHELIAPWLLAIGQGLPVEALGKTVLLPGSAFAASRDVGLDGARAALASPRVKTMVRLMRMFG